MVVFSQSVMVGQRSWFTVGPALRIPRWNRQTGGGDTASGPDAGELETRNRVEPTITALYEE